MLLFFWRRCRRRPRMFYYGPFTLAIFAYRFDDPKGMPVFVYHSKQITQIVALSRTCLTYKIHQQSAIFDLFTRHMPGDNKS